MQFTYQAYRGLLLLLREQGYEFSDYHHYAAHDRCVILRHDIDQNIGMALRLGRVEAVLGASSTYFVLLTGDFYNPASKSSLGGLRELQAMGHEIGLHFDETAYEKNDESVPKLIVKEAGILSEILGSPVTTVSMHQPTQKTLAANYQIPGIVNSYGATFFHQFKYLSDSCHHWREPVDEIIRSGQYDRLHILTHAFWYHEQEKTTCETLKAFITAASQERYSDLINNTPIYKRVLREEEA